MTAVQIPSYLETCNNSFYSSGHLQIFVKSEDGKLRTSPIMSECQVRGEYSLFLGLEWRTMFHNFQPVFSKITGVLSIVLLGFTL